MQKEYFMAVATAANWGTKLGVQMAGISERKTIYLQKIYIFVMLNCRIDSFKVSMKVNCYLEAGLG